LVLSLSTVSLFACAAIRGNTVLPVITIEYFIYAKKLICAEGNNNFTVAFITCFSRTHWLCQWSILARKSTDVLSFFPSRRVGTLKQATAFGGGT